MTAVEESLPPSPSPSPFRIGFKPASPPPPTTIPSPASSPEAPAEELLPPLDSETEFEHDEMPEPHSESHDGTPSRGSTRASNPLVGEGLREMARNGVIIASHQASQFLARTEGQRQVQLYLADADDAASIGDPLARIAARRDGVGEMSPDSADLLAAMMGIAGYASKQIQRGAVARSIDAGRVDGVQPMPTADDLGDQA